MVSNQQAKQEIQVFKEFACIYPLSTCLGHSCFGISKAVSKESPLQGQKEDRVLQSMLLNLKVAVVFAVFWLLLLGGLGVRRCQAGTAMDQLRKMAGNGADTSVITPTPQRIRKEGSRRSSSMQHWSEFTKPLRRMPPPPPPPRPDPTTIALQKRLSIEVKHVTKEISRLEANLKRHEEAIQRIRSNIADWQRQYDEWLSIHRKAKTAAIKHSIGLFSDYIATKAVSRLDIAIASKKKKLKRWWLPKDQRAREQKKLAELQKLNQGIQDFQKGKMADEIAGTLLHEEARQAFLKVTSQILKALAERTKDPSVGVKRSVGLGLIFFGADYSYDITTLILSQRRVLELSEIAGIHAKAGEAARTIAKQKERDKRKLEFQKELLERLESRVDKLSVARLQRSPAASQEMMVYASLDIMPMHLTYGGVVGMQADAVPLSLQEDDFHEAWVDFNCALAAFALVSSKAEQAGDNPVASTKAGLAYQVALAKFEESLEALWVAPLPRRDRELVVRVLLLQELLPPMDLITQATVHQAGSGQVKDSWLLLEVVMDMLN